MFTFVETEVVGQENRGESDLTIAACGFGIHCPFLFVGLNLSVPFFNMLKHRCLNSEFPDLSDFDCAIPDTIYEKNDLPNFSLIYLNLKK